MAFAVPTPSALAFKRVGTVSPKSSSERREIETGPASLTSGGTGYGIAYTRALA
mgnify:CR=1 FL=1